MLARFVICVLVLAFTAHGVEAKTREECERAYSPRRGQSGKDVIWWPTEDGLVSRMLKMARVTPQDVVYDLGAGDGRIAITAAKQFGARAVGIEYEADLVRFGQCLAEVAGVGDRVVLKQGDIFESDFSEATVVTLYLLQKLNLRLRPALLDMKPGTRIVSHSFDMGEWEPDDRIGVDFGEAFLWVVPAKVAGTWRFGDFTVALQQNYQHVRGTAGNVPLEKTKLEGSQIEFSFNEGGKVTHVTGVVNGDRIEAKVTRNNTSSTQTGTRT